MMEKELLGPCGELCGLYPYYKGEKSRIEKIIALYEKACVCAPKQQKICAQIRQDLHGLCIVTQTENPIVTQNRTSLRQRCLLDKTEKQMLHKSDRV